MDLAAKRRQDDKSSKFLTGATASAYLMVLLCFIFGFLNSMIRLGASLYALHLGASETTLGILVAGFVVCGVFLSPLGAMLCDRLGLRPVVVLSFCLLVAGCAANRLAVSALWLIPGQVLAGVGDMLFTVGGFAYLAEIASHGHQNLAHSLAFTGLGAGVVGGSALGGYVAEWVGFGGVFLLGMLVSVVALFLALCLSSVNPQIDRAAVAPRRALKAYQTTYNLLRSNETVRLVALLAFLSTLGWYTFGSSFYLDYLHRLAMPAGTIGLLRAVGLTAMVLAPSLFFSISNRVDSSRVILFGLLIGGLGLTMTPFLTSSLALAIVGILSQTADRFRLPGGFALLRMGTRSQERPTAMSIMNASWALAAFLGGPFWGLIAQVIGLSNVFLLAGGSIMVGAAVIFVKDRRFRDLSIDR